jgi:tetratricopeptide (TPR) repeat protein
VIAVMTPGTATSNASAAALAVACLALVVAMVAAVTSWSGQGEGVAPDRVAPDSAAATNALRARLERLEAALANAPPRADGVNWRSEAIDWERIERLVDDRLARWHADPARSGAPAETSADARTKASWFAELATAWRGPRADELWAQLRAAGAIDEAVAWFEQQAGAQPESADAQTSLGIAYVEQLLASKDEAERITIGTKVDAQFARALELAPDHWEARFRRAVGQSYGTLLSGTRSQAVANFEQLVRQQSNQPPAPGFEQTYVYLGRLYAEQGQPEQAAQAWRLGLARHPGDATLRQLVDGLGAHR